MSPRLAREFQRLYGPADAPAAAAGNAVRALVLDVARPADWRPLAAVWQGVQADLGLPAPAIVANGSDGLQLWFSLAQPVPAATDIKASAIRKCTMPSASAAKMA